ncbi:MAG TPA: cobalt ECF transporter T component CbiQ [Armatimonadota bacterium]|jgi:cobalt/nickel transport system permease protein
MCNSKLINNHGGAARGGGWLQDGLRRLHPVSKVLACLGLVLGAVSLAPLAQGRLAAVGGGLALLWLVAGFSPLTLAKRLAVAAPFVGLAALCVLFGSPHTVTAGVGAFTFPPTPEAVARFELLLLKAGVSLVALSLLGATTTPEELLGALRTLRVPALLVTTLALTIRYLSVLREEAQRMLQARDSRGCPTGLRRRARVTGSMIGSLFLRSYERAERVGHAMAARGFTGSFPGDEPRRLTHPDLLAPLLTVGMMCWLVLW